MALCMLVACVTVVVEAGNASARECFDGKTPCEDAAPAYPESAFRTFYLSFQTRFTRARATHTRVTRASKK